MSKKPHEHNLVPSKQHLHQSVIESFPNAYAHLRIVFNRDLEPEDYIFLEVNRAFEEIISINRNNIINRSLSSILKNIKKYEYDWINSLNNLVKSNQENEFEQYSQYVNKWLKLSIQRYDQDQIVVIISDVTKEKIQKRAIDQLIIMFDEFKKSTMHSIDFQAIAQGILELSDAKFAAINIYEQSGNQFRTLAIAGDTGVIKHVVDLLGFELSKKLWAHDTVRASKIKKQTITIFPTLADLVGKVLPKRLVDLLASTFNVGEVVLVKIQRDKQMIGDFTLFMSKDQSFKSNEFIVIFANQLAMMIDRRRIDNEIQASEKRFSELILNIDAGVVVHDKNGAVIKLNAKANELLGYTTNQMIGKIPEDVMWKFVHENGTDVRVEDYPVNLVLNSKKDIKNKIFGIVHRDSSDITWVNVFGTPILDEEGKIVEIVVSFSDYTELKNSRDSIVASEQQYKLLTTQMQLGLALHEIICDESGKPFDYRFISINDKYEELTGLKKIDVIGKTVLEVLPNTEDYWVETFGKVAISGNTIRFENYSSELDKHFSVAAYSPKKGQFAVLVDDITERKNYEAKIRQNLDDLIETQKIAKIGTWRRNLEDNQVFWSDELYRIYGLDPNRGTPSFEEFSRLFSPEDVETLVQARQRAREFGEPYELELKVNHCHGRKWVWMRGDVERNENGQVIGLRGAVQDITLHKIAEQQIRENNNDLKESQRIAKLGMWVRDPYSGEAIWSDELYRIYGLDPKSAPPKADEVDGFFTIESRRILNEAMDLIKSTGKSFELELELCSTQGINKWVWVRTEADRNDKGEVTLLRGAVLDITDRKHLENKLTFMSYHDHLTGLHNRRFYEETLEAFDHEENYPLSIIVFDVNGLKVVNDSFGHTSGDELLVKSAESIKKFTRKQDIVARIGGDEFIVIMPNTASDKCSVIANQIKEYAYTQMVENIHLSISYGYGTKTLLEQDISEVIANAENYMYRHKLYERSSTRSHTIDLILSALFEKSNREAEHSERVSYMCQEIAKKMGLSKDKVEQIGIAGLIHDIGKIGVDERVLNKEGILTLEERKEIERHPEIGWRILSSANEFANLSLFVLHHHEKWDGTGYPNGLKEEEIELEARIIAVADAYDAMTSERSYRKGMSKKKAIEELKRCAGSQFDAEIVDVFVHKVLSLKDFEQNYEMEKSNRDTNHLV